MTAIPARTIRLSYLMPCDAAHAAFIVSQQCGVKISALALKLRWQEELESCAPLRELGERPEKGFRRNEQVKLVEQMIGELVE